MKNVLKFSTLREGRNWSSLDMSQNQNSISKHFFSCESRPCFWLALTNSQFCMDFMLNYGLGEFIPETNQVEIDIMGKMMRATVLEGPPVKTQPIREKEEIRGKQ